MSRRLSCGNMQRLVDGMKGAKTLCLRECGASTYRLFCIGPTLVVCVLVIAFIGFIGDTSAVRCKILQDKKV